MTRFERRIAYGLGIFGFLGELCYLCAHKYANALVMAPIFIAFMFIAVITYLDRRKQCKQQFGTYKAVTDWYKTLGASDIEQER